MHNLLKNFLLQTKDCDIELTLPLSKTAEAPQIGVTHLEELNSIIFQSIGSLLETFLEVVKFWVICN